MGREIQTDDGRTVIRSDGETYQEMLDREVNPVPDALRESTDTYLGSEINRRWIEHINFKFLELLANFPGSCPNGFLAVLQVRKEAKT